MVDKLVKRIVGWKGKQLSSDGKLTLLKSCLASIPTYLLSVIKFPRWAIENLNSQMVNFLWHDVDGKHKSTYQIGIALHKLKNMGVGGFLTLAI